MAVFVCGDAGAESIVDGAEDFAAVGAVRPELAQRRGDAKGRKGKRIQGRGEWGERTADGRRSEGGGCEGEWDGEF